jgi:enoyl-CoA hydratase
MIKIDFQDGIFLLTFSRPESLNALNRETMNELDDFFSKQHGPIKGVILTGDGDKAFVAGADIKEFLELDHHTGFELAKRGQEIFNKIENFSYPVIAAVNGFALGGGCELAMACHLRIANESAKFGQPEVNLGIIPGYGGTQRLPQLVGKGKALELMLSADIIDGQEAHRIGLVNKLVPKGTEVEEAKNWLNKFAKKGPIAMSMVLKVVSQFYEKVPDGYDQEAEAFSITTASLDFKEGAAAFIEKRAPEFKGI